MNDFWQNLTVFLLTGVAVGYAGYLFWRRFFARKSPSPCDGCDGCALKKKAREKKCPKGLFPPK